MWICDTHSDTLYAMGVQHAKELMITPQRLRQGALRCKPLPCGQAPRETRAT